MPQTEVDRLNEAKEKAAPETMAEGSVAPAEAEINVFLKCVSWSVSTTELLIRETVRQNKPRTSQYISDAGKSVIRQ